MQLELEYTQLAARTKEGHPDRKMLEREIAALRQQTGGLDAKGIEAMLAQARAELAARRKELADSHPDVESAARAVTSLEEQLASARASSSPANAGQRPENPAYITIQSALDSARAEREYLRQKKASLAADLAEYEQRVKDGPKIEREYRALTRDYENAVTKYREIKSKEMEAELAESLETERKAERFVLIEPAVVPGKPIKPNRMAIVFLGAVLSLGGGLGTTLLRELMSPGMYGTKAVAAVTGAPPLAVIPYIETGGRGAAAKGGANGC